jgi:hypothetical protein
MEMEPMGQMDKDRITFSTEEQQIYYKIIQLKLARSTNYTFYKQ